MSNHANLIILSKKTALFGVDVIEIRFGGQVEGSGKIKKRGLSFGATGVMIGGKKLPLEFIFINNMHCESLVYGAFLYNKYDACLNKHCIGANEIKP